MKKYVTTLFIAFCILVLKTNAQEFENNFSFYSSFPKEKIKGLAFNYSFQYMKLEKADYYIRTEINGLKFDYGNSYEFRYISYPIMVDFMLVAAYYTALDKQNETFYPTHTGFNFSGNVFLPTYKYISYKLAPYVGIGYQVGGINFENSHYTECPLWKVGAFYLFSEDFYINTEFRRPFSRTSRDLPYQQITFGIGIRGESLKKTLRFIGEVSLLTLSLVLFAD